jgi:hypothetical protein
MGGQNLSHHLLDLTVQHKDHGGSDGTKGVGSSTLKESGGAFVLHDLGETIHGALVHPLGLGLLGLHLKTTTDGVHGVGSVTSKDGGELGNGELGGKALEITLLLVGVHLGKGVIDTEVHTTVGDDTGDGHTEAVVKAHETGRSLGGLGKAISKAVEGPLAGSDIGGKTSTGIVKGVDDAQGTGTGKTTGGHVDGEELAELCLPVSLGEKVLDDVLEGEVKGLGREVTNHVGEVSTPEGTNALLGGHTGEAVADTSVTGHLTGDDHRVGVLGLDDELHTLDRSSGGLRDGSRDATGKAAKNLVPVIFGAKALDQ